MLLLLRRLLGVLGLYIRSESHPHDGIVTNWIIVSLLTGFLMITFDFILTHWDELEEFLYAIMQFVTFVTVYTCYICFALEKRATFQLFEKFEIIANDYGNSGFCFENFVLFNCFNPKKKFDAMENLVFIRMPRKDLM